MAGHAVTELPAGQLPELTTGRLLSTWQLDAPALLLVVALGALHGCGAMLGIAELIALRFLLAILFQWARAERAQSAALDRRLDAELAVVVPVPTDRKSVV